MVMTNPAVMAKQYNKFLFFNILVHKFFLPYRYQNGNDHKIDIEIASITKAHNAVVVTNNEDHFSRIEGLKVENWLKL